MVTGAGSLASLRCTADNALTVKFAASTGAVTVSVVDIVAPPNAAVMLTAVDAAIAVVFTMNVALVAPAATVTVAGAVAAALLLVRVTDAALDGALLRVTVPCAAPPPATVVGLTVTLESTGVWTGGSVPLSPLHATPNAATAIAAAPATKQRLKPGDGVIDQPPDQDEQ
jgi:hypothetical protein